MSSKIPLPRNINSNNPLSPRVIPARLVRADVYVACARSDGAGRRCWTEEAEWRPGEAMCVSGFKSVWDDAEGGGGGHSAGEEGDCEG